MPPVTAARAAVRCAAPEDHAAIAQLCRAYRADLLARNADLPDIVETYYAEAAFEQTLANLPRLHARPDGVLLAATLGADVVGCAMTTRRSDTVCEIKRVFVSAEARGAGLARKLCQTAMQISREDGYATMVLDTMSTLTEAIALYERLGFTKAAPFYEPDPLYADRIRFYEIQLSPGPDQAPPTNA